MLQAGIRPQFPVPSPGDHRARASALNRALLARQLLLDRHAMPAAAAIEHLVGLQAQEPLEPYVGLWSRLRTSSRPSWSSCWSPGRPSAPRLMRRTLHLVTADGLARAAPAAPADARVPRCSVRYGRRLRDVDLAELAAAGRPLFEEQPRIVSEVGRPLVERWPGVRPVTSATRCCRCCRWSRCRPAAIWGQTAPARHTTVEAWLGRPVGGPARRARRWCCATSPLTAPRPAPTSAPGRADRAARDDRPPAPQLRVFRDERGRELLDVPDGPLPDPGHAGSAAVPARVRQRRARLRRPHPDHRRRPPRAQRRGRPLRAGRRAGRGTWTVVRDGDAATLRISRSTASAPADRDAVVDEGERRLAFLTDGAADPRVEIVAR